MATKLGIYNSALVLIGSRKIESLSEPRESRRILDSIWDDGLVDYVLEQGEWSFACRTLKYENTESAESQFGHDYLFELPSDHIKTMMVSLDEYLNTPYLDYREEEGYIKAISTPIYIKYISNGATYGGDLSLWPESFSQYVTHYLAFRSAESISKFSENKMLRLEKQLKRKLTEAKSLVAMRQPTQFLPTGSWVMSRRGNRLSSDRRNQY